MIDAAAPCGAASFHPTNGAAADAHLADHGIAWTP
jgi:hypothetical protein